MALPEEYVVEGDFYLDGGHAAMRRLLTDNHLRQKMGSLAQASVIERFDRARVIDRIERLYQLNTEPDVEIVR